MKYFLLLCFLLALVDSKVPNQPFISFLKNSLSADEEDPCEQASESKDVCLAKTLDNQNTQCCYIKMDNEENSCQPSPKPLSQISNIIKTKQFKPFVKEIYGFSKYGMGNEKKMEIPEVNAQVSCQDEELNVNFGGDKYTEDEIKILQSPDHCLNYTLSTFLNFYKGEQKEYDCTKGQLLQSSKDADIECGTLTAHIKMGAQETNVKTCIIFSYDMFSKITIPSQYSQLITEGIKEKFGGKITVELSDSKGRMVSFDSETGQIVSNNGSILTISKYLFLLSLFLF
jgi:hypothetical protein